jgi:hypothetical protein
MKNVEYRVRKVERFIVTRWQSESAEGGASVCSTSYGEFDTICEANEVADALAVREGNLLSARPEDKITVTPYNWAARDSFPPDAPIC